MVQLASARASACCAARDSANSMNALTSSRTGPTAERTTYQARWGSAPQGRIVGEHPELELQLNGAARLQRQPEPETDRLLDRPLEPRVRILGVSLVRREVPLDERPGARARLAHQHG